MIRIAAFALPLGLLLLALAASPPAGQALAEPAKGAVVAGKPVSGKPVSGKPGPGQSRHGKPRHEQLDHDRARAALQAGEILPLPVILERVRQAFAGDVLEVELEARDGDWLYKVRLLTPDGQLLRLDLDAGTADLLSARGRHMERPPRPPRLGEGR